MDADLILQNFDESLLNAAFDMSTENLLLEQPQHKDEGYLSALSASPASFPATPGMKPYSTAHKLDDTPITYDGIVDYDQDILLDLLSLTSPDPSSPEVINKEGVCPVCGNEAGKHSHYGGRGCTSCRAFFRRSVQNNSYRNFTCTNGSKNCKIDSKSWKSCRWCRFQKCLGSGMQPAWVLSEEERKVRHEKRTSKNRANNANKYYSLVPMNKVPKVAFSEDEMMMFLSKHHQWKAYVEDQLSSFYSRHTNVFYSLISALYMGTILPYHDLKVIEQGAQQIYTNFFINVSDMDGISQHDRMSLINGNYPLLMNFGQAVAFGNNHTSSSLKQFFKAIIEKKPFDTVKDHKKEEQMQMLRSMMQKLNVASRPPEGAVKYEQVFTSPWLPHISLEERHKEITQKICVWPVDSAEHFGGKKTEVNVDTLMIFYLCHILLFTTDFVQLEDAGSVTKVQDKYLKMLHRYLQFKYDREANKRLGNGIMIASLARESHEIRSKRLPI